MKLSDYSIKKQWLIVAGAVLTIPFWIFIWGGYATYKIYQSKIEDKVKYSLIFFSIVGTLFLGNKWVNAFIGNDSNSSSVVSVQQVDKTQVSSFKDLNDVDEVVLENDFVEEPQKYTVTRVIDGDTIVLNTGEKLRYIGIDTPETKHPTIDLECYGEQASKRNRELVNNKEIRLEKDVSETDRYGRLLRYVYVGDIFVNEYLVREGFAKASSYSPDIKYQDRFKKAEQEARENKRGLWGDVCKKEAIIAPTSKPKVYTPKPTVKVIPSVSNGGSFNCNCSKTCSQMSSCEEAYYQLNQCGCSRRDGDSDGVPCESICR